MSDLQKQVEQERQEAREACDINGAGSPECAAAWDAVEELQAEVSHKKQEPEKTPFQKYCDENPEAEECRVYED